MSPDAGGAVDTAWNQPVGKLCWLYATARPQQLSRDDKGSGIPAICHWILPELELDVKCLAGKENRAHSLWSTPVVPPTPLTCCFGYGSAGEALPGPGSASPSLLGRVPVACKGRKENSAPGKIWRLSNFISPLISSSAFTHFMLTLLHKLCSCSPLPLKISGLCL